MNIKEFQQKIEAAATFANPITPYFNIMGSLGYFAQTVADMQCGRITPAQEQSDNKVNIRRLLVDVADICSLNGWDMEEIAKQAIDEFIEVGYLEEDVHGTHTEGVDVRSVQVQD
jgi:hypothetical protein